MYQFVHIGYFGWIYGMYSEREGNQKISPDWHDLVT